ncbi:LysR substrate-binding domain-containing protein [Paraburkholderia phymatum]|uniref:LysR substrate-binding domain-containing protein n=1 Tax=Paraburkholderia phymatum TaxID=148447 RepID=UPI003175D2D7
MAAMSTPMDFVVFNLNDLHFFVQAIDAGGFAPASRRLGCPKSTVSKRVAELEAALGILLVHRTSRSFVLTDVGHEFYDHARAALIEAEAAEEVAHRRLSEPAGVVRMTASVPATQFRLARQLPMLARKYPKLQIRLHVTDRFVDLVQEGFDIAIRSHRAPLPDSGLLSRQIRVEPIVFVASADYLSRRGTPSVPSDLGTHDGLLIGASAADWTLFGPGGQKVSVSTIPRLFADESIALLRSAEAGLGIAALPRAIVESAIEDNRLVRVLPEWRAGNVTSTILTPHRRGQLPAVRAIIDFLAQDPSSNSKPATRLD